MEETELKDVERARRVWVSRPAGGGAIATAVVTPVGGEIKGAKSTSIGGETEGDVGEISAVRVTPELNVEGPAAIGRIGGDNSKTIGDPIGGVSSPENRLVWVWVMGDPTPLNEISSDLLLGFSS
jgi:hypothetical protein